LTLCFKIVLIHSSLTSRHIIRTFDHVNAKILVLRNLSIYLLIIKLKLKKKNYAFTGAILYM